MLNGKVELKTDKFLIVDVNGIGWRVFCLSALIESAQAGQTIKLFCHLHVREDALELFGFLNYEELAFFELLIAISGIGPRMGLGILSVAPVAKIKEAIAGEREEFLTRVSGIGSKIAKKVILELKDKLPKISGAGQSQLKEEVEAIDALVALGDREQEAREVVRGVVKEVRGTENVIRVSLKYLGKK